MWERIILHSFAESLKVISVMAYYIEPAPVLEGRDAERFLELMSTADTRKVDYSAKREIARRIIGNSDIEFLQ